MPKVIKDATPEVKTQTIVREVDEVVIGVPLGELGNGYLSRHVEARLTVRQAVAMHRMTRGLRDRRETMADGREVRTPSDALRWMLESMAKEFSDIG